MAQCIYCRKRTTGREPTGHAIPEALCANQLVLPPGAVCHPCNAYLSDLDSALVRHRQIWLGIQVLGLPGKSGKVRAELGWMTRPHRGRPNVVRIESRGKNVLWVKGPHIRIETAEAPSWNPSKFARSLHYLGFNYLALTQGAEFVLRHTFDPVRRYIRSPSPQERWPYGEVQASKKLVARIGMSRLAGSHGQVVEIQIFSTVFFVNLVKAAEFAACLRRIVPNITLV